MFQRSKFTSGIISISIFSIFLLFGCSKSEPPESTKTVDSSSEKHETLKKQESLSLSETIDFMTKTITEYGSFSYNNGHGDASFTLKEFSVSTNGELILHTYNIGPFIGGEGWYEQKKTVDVSKLDFNSITVVKSTENSWKNIVDITVKCFQQNCVSNSFEVKDPVYSNKNTVQENKLTFSFISGSDTQADTFAKALAHVIQLKGGTGKAL